MDVEISLERTCSQLLHLFFFFLQTSSCTEARSNLYSVSKQMALWLHVKFPLSKYLLLNIKK